MVKSVIKNIKIKGMSVVLGENKVQFENEPEFWDNDRTKLEKLKKMIGFSTRYRANKETTTEDLCEQAAKNLIEHMRIKINSIDGIIFATQTPDYYMPGNAHVIHRNLGFSNETIAIDLEFGCSGFIYGLFTAASMLNIGLKRILLLTGDTLSKSANPKDRTEAPLFGDAGSATYLEYIEEDNTAYFSLGTDGTGWDRIIAPASAKRLQLKSDICDKEIEDKNGNIWKLNDTIIHGQDVFNFTIEVAPQNIKDVMEYAQKTDSDIDYYVIHQANKQIVESVAMKADIPDDKYSSQTFSKYGNNSTTSVATAICDQLEGKKYNTILLSAFGVGLSWASAIININNLYNGGISYFIPPENMLTREEQIQYWIKQFKGE